MSFQSFSQTDFKSSFKNTKIIYNGKAGLFFEESQSRKLARYITDLKEKENLFDLHEQKLHDFQTTIDLLKKKDTISSEIISKDLEIIHTYKSSTEKYSKIVSENEKYIKEILLKNAELDKKRHNNKIWAYTSTGLAAILGTILILK